MKYVTHHTPGAARVFEAAEHGAKPVCLGKAPKPKGYPILVHGGTPPQNYDSNPANPLNSGPPIGKRLTPVMPSPGMRSRTNEGAVKPSLAEDSVRILNEAGDNSAGDDRRALGIGSLPNKVNES